MVGFTEDTYSLSGVEYGIAGAVSGAVCRAIISPLDVLKIRFQLQVEPLSSRGVVGPTTMAGGKYHSMAQALHTIVRDEGLIALWKGHVASQALALTYVSAQFITFEFLTERAWFHLPERLHRHGKLSFWVHFLCGGFAGCTGTILSMPVDVIRTRLVSQGEPKVYSSISQAVQLMYRTEGLRSFYRGLLPSIYLLFPNTGLAFAFYALFNDLWTKSRNRLKNDETQSGGVLQSMCCGGVSGLLSKSIVYPLDFTKKRLQVQGFDKARAYFGEVRHYSGLTSCFKTVLKEEGVLGFYKGFGPSMIKAATSVGITFCVYEQVCRVLKFRRQYMSQC